MNAWNVCIENETKNGLDDVIDTVFYDSDCDAQYVYDSLVNHDGYSPSIYVELENGDNRYPEQQ